jgi:MoaA/NifB/PqqE/SkfB family radical SAM enzyme
MTRADVEPLDLCRSLDELYERYAPLGVYGSRRFVQLELDITNRCNIRCVMCYHSFESTRRAKTVQMTPETFALAAARVLPHAHRLTLSLGNEPLMSPHFVPILRIAARHGVPNVNFFTNGLLLDTQNIDAIINHHVTQVCVSIDGATPATYNYIRRDGDFHKLLGNVELLIARRNARRSSTPIVRFDFVMMQRNIHELEDLARLAARLGVEQLSLRHMVSFEGLGMEHESLQHTKALSNYWLDRALAAAAELGLDVQTHPDMFDLPDENVAPAPVAPNAFMPTPYCPFPFFHISMGPEGHVLPCPHSHGEAPYGRLTATMPVDVIWLGPRFNRLRQRILRHDPPDMCRRCPYLSDKYPDVADFFVTRKP